MILRIQSLYLLLACVAMTLMLMFPVARFEQLNNEPNLPHQTMEVSIAGKYEITSQGKIQKDKYELQMIFVGIIILSTLISIFLFKNREVQIQVARLGLFFTIILMVLIFINFSQEMRINDIVSKSYDLGAFLPSVTVIFAFLASRAIQKDEKLIQSAERIR